MVEIKPFRGIIYNQEKIKDLTRVTAPPYDIIKCQNKYYKKSEYNIIRLILSKEPPADNLKNNKYKRAKNLLNEWVNKKILKQDHEPCIYIYEQTFLVNNREKIRTGIITLVKIEDYDKKIILPHEGILKKPKMDRLKLISECKANLSSILALYKGTKKINSIITKEKTKRAFIDFLDENRIRNKVWRINNKEKIDKIIREMKNKQLFIADGHHRYEAALEFKNKFKQKEILNKRSERGFEYIMATLVDINDPGLVILPTHRLVNLNFDIENVKNEFEIKVFEEKEKMFDEIKIGKHRFGVYLGNNRYYLLILKNKEFNDVLEALDVTILHKKLITKYKKSNNIGYTESEETAINLVNNHKYKAAFFLNPTTIEEVIKVAKAGKRVKQKTTYFYPKLLTGLIINKF